MSFIEASRWAIKHLYGITKYPDDADHTTYFKSLLLCAAGDGVLAPEERAWVVGLASTIAGDKYSEMVKNYAANEDLLQILQQNSRIDSSARHVMLYDAIRACAADGVLSNGEREAIQKMANFMDVTKETVAELEKLYNEETAQNNKRRELLFPVDSPWHN